MADEDSSSKIEVPEGITLIDPNSPAGAPSGGFTASQGVTDTTPGFTVPEGITDTTPANPPGRGVLLNPGGNTNQGPYPTPPTPPEQKSFTGFLGNVLSSGANLVENVAKTVVPLDATNFNDAIPLKRAADTLYDLFYGTGRAAARWSGIENLPNDPDSLKADQTVQAFRDYVANRYGSWDRFKDAFYHDPVGIGTDLSTLATGAGVAVKAAGKLGELAKLGRTAELVSTTGNVLSKTGEITNPMFVPGKIVSGAISALTPKTPVVAPPPAVAQALSPQALEDAIRERAFDISKVRTSGDPTSDWLQAEQEMRNPQPAASATPAATPAAVATRGKVAQAVRNVLGSAGAGAGAVIATEAIQLLTHHITEALLGGTLAFSTVKYALPALLKSSAGQSLLSAIGPGSTPARAAAALQNLAPTLNTIYKSQQQQPQQQISLEPYTRARGGAVNPELARIQRERLRLPGILVTLERNQRHKA